MRPPKNNFAEYAIANNMRYLIDEYSKDNPIPPDEIGYNSSLKVKWVCEYGHIIYESPYNRIRRGYCPICGKLRKGSFAQNFPELAKMWSNNNKLRAEEIPPTYTGIVLWKCKHGHEWARRISLQIKLQTCPYCEQEEKNFFEHHPEMLDCWDEELNGNIETKTVNGDFVKQLDNAVKNARHNKEWRVEYMHSVVHDRDMINKGRNEGKIETLIALVKDGDITVEIAAQKADMSVDEFKKLMNN